MGVEQLLELISLRDDEELLLVGDESTDWAVEQLAAHAASVYLLPEDQRPLTEVPEDLQKLLSEKDVLLYIISKAGSDERVFRDSLNTLAESQGIRVGNLMDVTPEILASAFREDPYTIKEFTQRLYEHMQTVREVHVASPAGSDFTVRFDEKYNWLASTGFIQYKKTRNAIPAEVYTYPARVNGTIVIDGAYAALVGHKDSAELLEKLSSHPITWIVEDSRITEVHCTHERIRELAHREIFEKDHENGNRIGEFGMGTNLGMKELFGNVMHDEKFPGIHIAHGHGYPSSTGAPYESSVHADGILLDATVTEVDTGNTIIRVGTYQKDVLE